MLAVLAYCRKDLQQTLSLLRWMAELDGLQTRHELLLVAAAELPGDTLKQVADLARLAFSLVSTIKPAKSVETGWPGACNHLFRTAATYVAKTKHCPFLWIEPDCIPLKPGWLDAVEKAYASCGRPFMGSTFHKPVSHLPGNAVYPPNIKDFNPFIMQQVKKGRDDVAWDCVRPELTLKFAADTPLFQHVWIQMGTDHPQTFKDAKSLSILRPDAVLFHRNKDHSLILRLRERRTKETPGLITRVREWIKPQPVPSSTSESEKGWKSLPVPLSKTVEEVTKAFVETPSRVTVTNESCPPIHTYHEKLAGFPDQQPLIELWKELWSTQGWQPVVLGEKDAKKGGSRGIYAKLLAAIQKLPTCNHRGYENACYLRHLAMANRGGGLITDYDVMPVDYPAIAIKSSHDPLLLEPTRVPCALWGTAEGYTRIIQAFLDYPFDPVSDAYQGKPHVSDMTILRRSKFSTANLCVEYLRSGSPKPNDPGDGWRQAKMIHFSSASMSLRNADATEKVKVIREVLAELRNTRDERLLQPV